jgi:transcriptional regulator
MYIPRVNEEKRVPVIHQMMRSNPLASLVTMMSEGLFASHIPMVVEDDGSEYGVLRGHLSRANTQWRDISPSIDALAMFTGPQHYISASWYPSKYEHGREVPTWNYVVVHAYGPLKVIEDREWLLNHLEHLTSIHEADSTKPWKIDDAPPDYIESLLKGIVGVELKITKLEGKWKVSQNRADRERHAVVEELDRLNTPESQKMKALVAERLTNP